MFAETVQLGLLLDPKAAGDRLANVHSNALADERPKDDIVGDEGEVKITLLVTGVALRGSGHGVGYEQERLERVRRALGNIRREDLPVGPEYDYEEEELERRG